MVVVLAFAMKFYKEQEACLGCRLACDNELGRGIPRCRSRKRRANVGAENAAWLAVST